MSDDIRQRYTDLITNWFEPGIRLARLTELLAVRDEEVERLRAELKQARRHLSALTAEPPPLPDGTGDDEARRGYAERTVDQWRKYGTHWRERAEKAEAANARTRTRLDTLIAAGSGATTDTLRELRAHGHEEAADLLAKGVHRG